MPCNSERLCLVIVTVLSIISVAIVGTTDTVQQGRDCCRSKNLPDACLPLCDISKPASQNEMRACKAAMQQRRQPQSRASMFTIHSCTRDGKDHTECCKQKGVPENCLDVCDARENINRDWYQNRNRCGNKRPFRVYRECQVGTDDQNVEDEQSARDQQIHDDLERTLKEQNKHWTPKAVRDFEGWSDSQLKDLTGLLKGTSPHSKTTLNHVKARQRRAANCNVPATLPANFDWRQQRPNCQSIKHIRNQGVCGSCWAVSSASVISDRYCIANGADRIFSAIQLTSALENKCQGGWPANAMNYYVNTGLVTGGDSSAGEAPGCQPYPTTFDQVPRACEGGEAPPREFNTCVEKIAPPASSTCQGSYGNSFAQDRQKGIDYYEIRSRNVDEIMREIYCNGPVVVAFAVYQDFFWYGNNPTNVYEHVPVTNNVNPVGYHAARIIGWGSDPIHHWLLANSWGTNTGLQGIYKIKRGSNEVGIEETITAVFTPSNTPNPNPNPTPAPNPNPTPGPNPPSPSTANPRDSDTIECCRNAGVSSNCLPFCDLSHPAGLFDSAFCIMDVYKIWQCSRDGVDHTACCQANNVLLVDCLQLCDGRKQLTESAFTRINLFCHAFTSSIKKCYAS